MPTASTLNQKVNLGDYALHLKCYGRGTSSTIIETGFGDPGAENEAWLPVIEELQKIAQVCVYDRLGLGSSTL